MIDRQKEERSRSPDPYNELMERNKHLKWPLIIIFLVIVILVILIDITSPTR